MRIFPLSPVYNRSMKKVLFTGGGSAGHVVPNLALIEELFSLGIDVSYMGTEGIEKELVSTWKIPYFEIACPKLVRGMSLTSVKNNLKIPFSFLRAVRQAAEGLKRIRPDLVFSKGGYVALPVVFAARRLKIPCLAHESDFSPGLANRLSARKCKYVLTSFPETAERFKNGKYVGAPIRKSLLAADKTETRKSFGISQNAKVLLVFGGGSGSAVINDAVRKNIKKLTENYVVLHVCGQGKVVESNVKGYRQFAFIKDMGAAYACADGVLARAGAGTAFELLSLKKPALLVPLEGATRGDQKENAAYFAKQGLCHVLPQGKLHELPQAIEKLFADDGLQTRLRDCVFQAGNDKIIAEIMELLS